ncbi:hypothetical protein [Xanthocytophaga agilis]|uniref:Uncharacterized protein n=1 Tax=Xanthocytophaga agilis TaxID=3048010 RepID=A0AAE3QZ12_9BACT|nr:hypothetical protein [Xanthocytophaga agilis]MDJ1500661.1 hypothetical protein [Xanthocytophaga agilis]
MGSKTEKGLAVMNKVPAIIKTANKNERIEFIFDCMSQGMRYNAIVKAFAAKYDCTERNAKKYMTEADSILNQHRQESAIKTANRIRLQYQRIFEKAMEDGNLGVAKSTLDSIKNMEGLDGIVKTANLNLNQNSEVDLSKLNTDELKLYQSLLIKAQSDEKN